MESLGLRLQYTCLSKRVGNVHAVSGCKISVHQFFVSEVLHSFGNLKTHIQHPFCGFTDLEVLITPGAYALTAQKGFSTRNLVIVRYTKDSRIYVGK